MAMTIVSGRRVSGSIRALAGVIVCGLGLGLWGVPSVAQAQEGARERRGGGPGGRAMEFMREFQSPVLTTEQIKSYGEMLGLSAEQREAAKALVEGAQSELRAQQDAMQEEFRRMREGGPAGPGGGGPGGRMEGIRERMDKLRADRSKIDATLMADLKSLLTPEQEAKWPAVERAKRREVVSRRGMISGERVDLVELTRRAAWPEEVKAKVAPQVEQYELDLDRLLVQREGANEDGLRGIRDKMREGDMEGAQRLMNEGRQASQRIRDLNLRAARELAGVLPEDQRAAFELEVKKATYPRVYRVRPLERQLEAAAGLQGLNETQVGEIKQLKERFGRDLGTVREKMESATLELENNATIEAFMDREWDERGAMSDLQSQRGTLERTVEDQLKKILGPELMEQLPKRDNDDEDDGDRPRRGDGPRRRGGQS
jgi:Spy/CpxP family protein refolding chaperone